VRYWWVNQNQTFRQEIGGGYLWSPKRNANGARNPFYESMREVAPGDVIFSFVDTRIVSIGIAQSYCYESPKPAEFGGAGLNWEAIGWRIRVNFKRLVNQVRPKEHMQVLGDLLPDRYSPLQRNGNGVQSIYLTEVPEPFAEALIGLIGAEASLIAMRGIGSDVEINAQVVNADLEVWERHLEAEVENDSRIGDTEREALIIARRHNANFGRFSSAGPATHHAAQP
jgi:putative restriction endonuclease